MSERWANDYEREYHTIDKVRACESGGWEVRFDGGWSFFIQPDSPVEPQVGMTMTQFGRGVGHPVRGVLLDGQCVYYRTADEDAAHHKRLCDERDAARRAEFEANRESMDQRYDALPKCFRDRIDKFRGNNPDFRWEFEDYELFTCEQAVVIARAIGDAEGVAAFARKPWDEQKAQVSGLSDDHSGNTFGAACRLAIDYLTNEDAVRQRHGALAPLVGSEAYGCVPREGAEP